MTESDLVKLELPPVSIVRRNAIGEIRLCIAKGRTADALPQGEMRLSPRRLAPVYKLDNGDLVAVSRWAKIPSLQRPPELSGIVHLQSPARGWLSHSRLEAVLAEEVASGLAGLRRQIFTAWREQLVFRAEHSDQSSGRRPGLRPAQLGALFAVGSHWSLSDEPATIVMPTGTGKTEAMLACLVGFVNGALLVVTPSKALRDQTAAKFETLGLLRQLGAVPAGIPNPIVGVLHRRPRSTSDLRLLRECNVIITTMSSIAQGTAEALGPDIANTVSALVVDEAHHIAAKSWTGFKENFGGTRILQFTATPFRRDRKLVDGKVIYTYPLAHAQRDGYFKPIRFEGLHEIDNEEADRALATAAVDQLNSDLAEGYEHLLLARCSTIARARDVHQLYCELGSNHSPLLVHSEDPDVDDAVETLRSGSARIVVCVDMLGEGFDLPELKIAAIHDLHKSLAVLLQFTGRFTRTSQKNIGEATVFANIADPEVSDSLERLYSEDADWNILLSEFSSQAVRDHSNLIQFLQASRELGERGNDSGIEISRNLLRPKFSTAVYRCFEFQPQRFHTGLSRSLEVHRVWLHEASRTLYFVTRIEPKVGWTRSRQLRDRVWDIFVLHHNAEQGLLYIHSSDKSSMHDSLARAVGGASVEMIRGDAVFRVLSNIQRLVFQNIGVKKHGRRNLRYAMYTGADVAQALSIAERAGSIKSNLSGSGYENGHPINVGCSYKGRVWCKEQGPVPSFVNWCEQVGAKLVDDSLDTSTIIENVLIPEEVQSLPTAEVLTLDWPIEMLRQSEERVVLKTQSVEFPLSMVDIELSKIDRANNDILFSISNDQISTTLALRLGGPEGYDVRHVSGPRLEVTAGRISGAITAFFDDYPPMVRFVDLSELDGNLLVSPRTAPALSFPAEQFEPWDWGDTDLTKESIWRDGVERQNSIQFRVGEHFTSGGFDVVFDDDNAGEAADLVCIREQDELLRLALVHCKFSGGEDPGRRVNDVVEVCSQAVRSIKWVWRFKELCRHITDRERRLRTAERPSRFLAGTPRDINRLVRQSRLKPVQAEIAIAQPGLSQQNCTTEQMAVLAAAHSFIQQTVAVGLSVICSA